MITPQELTQLFSVTTWVCQNQAKGLTHEQSLLQPPFRGNCFNWVLGHIVVNRNDLLKMLDADPILTDEEAARYKFDSEPVVSEDDNTLPLERLLNLISTSQKMLEEGFNNMPKGKLDEIVNEERQTTFRYRLLFMHFHESYHSGQLELLRQLAGMDDSVI